MYLLYKKTTDYITKSLSKKKVTCKTFINHLAKVKLNNKPSFSAINYKQLKNNQMCKPIQKDLKQLIKS